MQNFSHKKQIDPQDVIINQPKKKINKQQIIFTIFFLSVFGYLTWYFTKDLYVSTFQGNIISHHNDVYLMNDIFLLDVKVEPGDVINAGDTMLIYIYTDMLYSVLNPIKLNGYQQEIYDLNMAKGAKILELRTLITQKTFLQKLANKTNKNISLGLNTRSDEIDYLIEIESIKQKIDYTRNMISHYSRSVDSVNVKQSSSFQQVIDPFTQTREFIDENIHKFGGILQYVIASEKTLVLTINKHPGNLVFKRESIMLVYPVVEGRGNIYIEMIMQPSFLNEMKNDEKVKIYFGPKYFGDGTIQINNTFMKDVSSFKLGQFSAGREAAIVRVAIDSTANLPLKYQVNGLPVKLRYNRNW